MHIHTLSPLVLLAACGGTLAAPKSPMLEQARYLPPQTSLVLALSVSSLKESEIYKAAHTLAMTELKENEPDAHAFLEVVRERCDLDPFRDLQWVVMAGGAELEEELVVLLGGSFTEEKFNLCAASMGWERALQGNVAAFEDVDLYITWPAPNVVAMTFDDEGLGYLSQVTKAATPNPQLERMIAEVDTGATLWGVLNNLTGERSLYDQLDLDELTEVKSRPLAASFSADVSRGLELLAKIRFASEPDASRVSGDWQRVLLEATQRSALSYFVGDVSIRAEADAAIAHLQLDDKKSQSLLAMAETARAEQKEAQRRWDEEWAASQAVRDAEREREEIARKEREASEQLRQAALAEQARLARDRAALEQAVERKRRAKAHSDQGRAFLDAGVYDKAVEEFKAANAQIPHPDFLYNVAFSYDNQRGSEREALSYYEQYLQAAPSGSMAEVARRRVAKITRKLRNK